MAGRWPVSPAIAATTPRSGSRCARTATTTTRHVVWNNTAGELWRRTKQAIERHLNQLARHRGLPYGVRVSHGKAAEYQARGAVHFHVLLRLDGLDPADPARLLPPPPGLTVADLEDATRHAAATITCTDPAPPGQPRQDRLGHRLGRRARRPGHHRAGYRHDHRPDGRLLPGQILHQRHRGHRPQPPNGSPRPPSTCTPTPTGTHAERLIHACWKLGTHPDYTSLQRWAHMLGFGGHFLTKARYYSVTFAALRAARITYRRTQDLGPEHEPIRTADHAGDEETTLIVGNLTYAGTGWKTTGDALLASTAADQARKRREAGNDELTDQYNRTAGRQAA